MFTNNNHVKFKKSYHYYNIVVIITIITIIITIIIIITIFIINIINNTLLCNIILVIIIIFINFYVVTVCFIFDGARLRRGLEVLKIKICLPGYHHNGFMATHAIGHMMYGTCAKVNELPQSHLFIYKLGWIFSAKSDSIR